MFKEKCFWIHDCFIFIFSEFFLNDDKVNINKDIKLDLIVNAIVIRVKVIFIKYLLLMRYLNMLPANLIKIFL